MNKGVANNSRTSRLMSLQSDQRKTPTTEDESVTKHQWMAANKQGTLLADQIYYKSAKEFNNQVSTMTK